MIVEIKPEPLYVRAKQLGGKHEWVEGTYQYYQDKVGDANYPHHVLTVSQEGCRRISYRVIGETVGMYTGISTLTGKKKWQHDLFLQKGRLYEIDWDALNSRFVAREIKTGVEFPLSQMERFDVIGNIFDNKKMVENARIKAERTTDVQGNAEKKR